MSLINEAEWEGAALEVLGELSWTNLTGQQISPSAQGEAHTETGLPIYQHLREKHDALEIPGLLRASIAKLNHEFNLTSEQINQVARDITTAKSTDAQAENQDAHRYLTQGYKNLQVTRADGSTYYPPSASSAVTPTKTPGSPSSKSPSKTAKTNADSTSCSTATACPSGSSN